MAATPWASGLARNATRADDSLAGTVLAAGLVMATRCAAPQLAGWSVSYALLGACPVQVSSRAGRGGAIVERIVGL